MAWLKEIPEKKCKACGCRATHTLMNQRNGDCGDYCGRHAKSALRHKQLEEEGKV